METLITAYEWITRLLDAAALLPDFSSPRGIFCAIAWIGTLISAIMFVVAFIADIGGGDLDTGSVDGDMGAFSLQAVMGFILGFGWGGYLAVSGGAGVGLGIFVGMLVGIIMFFVIAGIMKAIYSLKSDGSLKYESLVGMTGTVYVTIPPKGEPGGQVQVSHPSQFITMAAVQDGDTPLPAQTRIEVVAATTYQLTVRPVGAVTSSQK
ncbi:MAG: NfeD family protein [Akkermansia sp.]|nr:NfeD family protein [Akkermansia sp.]